MDMIFELISNFFGIEPLGLAIVCGLVFLAGYVDAIAGGGGLISLPAYLIAGVPTHAAIATNKLSSCMGTTVATFHYAKSGFINARLALPSIVFAFLGSFCGSNVLLLVDDGFLRLFLLVVLPVTAIYVMKSKSFDAAGLQSFSLRKTTLLCMGIAFAVGVYDGFYGPGTGTFLIFAFLYFGYNFVTAAGNAKTLNLASNLGGLVAFLVLGKVYFWYALPMGLVEIAGARLGARMAIKKGVGYIRTLFLIVTIVLIGKQVYDLFLK